MSARARRQNVLQLDPRGSAEGESRTARAIESQDAVVERPASQRGGAANAYVAAGATDPRGCRERREARLSNRSACNDGGGTAAQPGWLARMAQAGAILGQSTR